MPGLVPGIHVLPAWKPKTWMAGTSPAMTVRLTKRAKKNYSAGGALGFAFTNVLFKLSHS
jgi:hypothetical protein